MTRKRTRENLVQQLCEPCPNCEGKGYLQSARSICHKIFRELPKAARYLNGQILVLNAHPAVAGVLLQEEADALQMLEETLGRKVAIHPNSAFHQEQFDIQTA
jgi:ribonuclease G